VRLVVHPEAAEELARDAEWYDQRRPGVGDDLLAEAALAFEAISEAPLRHPLYPGSTTLRRLLFRNFHYFALYSVQKDRVIVVAISSSRRRPGYWASRT
jgi:plasmid stabilization system protein ParE